MTESLAAALAELQMKLPEIRKSETAYVRSDKGNYSYSYADLAAISRAVLPRLGELGLSFTSRPTLVGDRFVLCYALLHSSGEREAGEYPLPSNGSPQAIGSAITYARRYALCAVTGVAPDDDDDDGAKAEADHRNRRQEPERPDVAVDPAEQQLVADAFEDEIAKVRTVEELTAVARNLLTAKRNGEIAKAQYDRLAIAGGRRKGELEPATEATTGEAS